MNSSVASIEVSFINIWNVVARRPVPQSLLIASVLCVHVNLAGYVLLVESWIL
jgi:hypothetical protein